MERLGVSISLTLGFHPESNGQLERVNGLRQKVGSEAPVVPGLALDLKPAPPPALPEAGAAVCVAI